MNAPRTIEGRWWLFGSDRPAHYGTLLFDPNAGLRLEVRIAARRGIPDILAAVGKRPDFPETIQGRDEQDEPVTLLGCCPGNCGFSGGLSKYTFHPLLAVLGQLLESWDSALYRKAQFHLTLLDKWMCRGRLHVGATEEHPLQVSIAPGNDIEVHLADGTRNLITYSYEAQPQAEAYCIKEKHGVRLEFTGATSAQSICTDYIQVWRRLLTLLTGTEVFVEDVSFEVPESGEPPDWAELLRRNEGVAKADRDRLAVDMTVPYKEIASDFPEVLKRWFEYHNRLDAALDLYFATVFNKKLWINQQFLFLAQALEVYHNSNPQFASAVQSKPEFRKRLRKFLCLVPKAERAWLIEKLQHANQKTLAQRLDEILDQHPSEVSSFIPNRKEFADRIRHTRNYYTHFDDELRQKRKIAEGDELTRLVQQMRTLLSVCILKDLGISGASLSRLITNLAKLRLVSLSSRLPPPSAQQPQP
jgi:hypothetical protein